MRARLTPVVVGLAAAAGVTACGSASPTTTTQSTAPTATVASRTTAPPVSATSPAQVNQAISALHAIPDSAVNRQILAVHNVGTLLHESGGATDQVTYVLDQAIQQSPIGTALIHSDVRSPTPLGYRASDLSSEIDVGDDQNALTEVFGPVSRPAVLAAARGFTQRSTEVGAATRLTLRPYVPGGAYNPLRTALEGVASLTVPARGGRLISAGRRADPTDLARGTAIAHSVADDPTVAPLLAEAGTSFATLTLGTELVTPAGGAATGVPDGAHISEVSGASRLGVGPEMVGLLYDTRSPNAGTVTALALFPTAADATRALTTTARYTQTGTSIVQRTPYSTQWRVTRTTTRGALVVMTLDEKFANAVANEVERGDFPLFYSPAR